MQKARTNARTLRGRIDHHRIGQSECDILEHLTSGDMLVGFLFSCHSTSRMHRIAHKRAQARAHAQYTFHRRLTALTKKGLIQLIEEKDGTYARLTDPGKSELAFLVVRSKKPAIWDGKWRLLMFDIPNTHSQLREELRGLIKRIGYVALQQSVYVFPYDIPELTTLLAKKNLPLSQVAYSTIDSLPRDAALRKHFTLPASS